MQAIETHILPSTVGKHVRYAAEINSGEKTRIRRDETLSIRQNHARAARALANKLHWDTCGIMVGASTKGGMAWVFIDGGYQA